MEIFERLKMLDDLCNTMQERHQNSHQKSMQLLNESTKGMVDTLDYIRSIQERTKPMYKPQEPVFHAPNSMPQEVSRVNEVTETNEKKALEEYKSAYELISKHREHQEQILEIHNKIQANFQSIINLNISMQKELQTMVGNTFSIQNKMYNKLTSN